MKLGAVEEVIYSCTMGLYERIPDCKLAMHDNCFNEIQKSMVHDLGSRHNGGSNRLDRLKSYCYHGLRDLCVQTDGAWWRWMYHLSKVLFCCVCVSRVMKGNDSMVCSICYSLFSSYISYYFLDA